MQASSNSLVLSIVTPVYQAETCIEIFYQRVTAAASQFTPHYEIIFVNDGSTDRSLEKLIALHEKDPHVVVIELSRNFGLHPAIRCGLEHTAGQYTFVIASDLQEAPEWLPLLYDKLQTSGVDIVYAREIKRINTVAYRILCKSFYSAIKYLSPSPITEIALARLMKKSVTDALITFRERSTVLDVLCLMAGFHYDFIEIVKAPQHRSTFTFNKRLMQAVYDHMTSLTTKPLLWAGYWAFFYIIVGVAIWISGYPTSTSGRTGIVILGMAGILGTIGIFGIYTATLLKEIKQRPLFIIRAIYKISHPVTLER